MKLRFNEEKYEELNSRIEKEEGYLLKLLYKYEDEHDKPHKYDSILNVALELGIITIEDDDKKEQVV